MKKWITLLIFWSVFQIYSSAQSSITPDQLGIGIGLYNSNIFYEHNYGVGLNDYLPTFGYDIGIKAAWALKANTLLNLELNYSQQGQKHEDWKIENDPEFYFQRQIDISYFKIPIYIQQVYSNPDQRLQWLWQAGFYTGILNQVQLTYIRRGESLSFYDAVTEKNDFANEITAPNSHNDLYRNLDLGLVVGWGLQYFMNERTQLIATLRSEVSILDINASDWRYPHREFGYRPSRHLLAGLKIGVQTQIR